MAEATPILRDILLDALRTLPGTRKFHIHVLQSAPRRNTSLFQFAKPRPRTFVQDIVVLLSEQHKPDSPRVLVTAIEGILFHIPGSSSAILYVCKVDSTGQSSGISPTRALVRGFLNYYANPATRPLDVDHVWIQLFARAQGQYLFPNSAEFEGKRPLSDVKLCAWWKRILSQVALDVDKMTKVQLYYLVPGFGQLEAEYSLKIVSSDVGWQYGHPYTRSNPLPCPANTQARNLGHYIPYFEDDPKSRFLDEIAYTTGGEVKSPVRKRAKTATSMDDSKRRKDVETTEKEKEKEKDDKPIGELGKVDADEFWERMSFRQECVAGAVTGFFTLIISTKKPGPEMQDKEKDRHSAPSPLEPKPGQVSSQIVKRVLTTLTTGVEFSTRERAIKATETLESTIMRLCEGIPSGGKNNGRSCTPEPQERSNSTLLAPPSTPPRKGREALPDITPNPFPEPTASMETYDAAIYGRVEVRNSEVVGSGSEEGGRAPVVTVLTARKKKRVV